MKQGLAKYFVPLLVALLSPALPVMAEDATVVAMTEDEAALVQLALNRGLDLYRYDQAAWHTTDSLREDIPDPAAAGVRGWVVTPAEGGLLVTYWRTAGDGYEAAYTALYDGDAVSQRKVHDTGDLPLSDEQVALVKANDAVEGSVTRCSKEPFNTVTVPTGKNDNSIFVYYLVPQQSLSEIPVGGHYRFEVRDGQLVEQRGFTKSCIDLKVEDGKGNKPAALMISHMLDPVPTEIHVFAMLTAGVPLYVSTTGNGHLWEVGMSDGVPRIRVVK